MKLIKQIPMLDLKLEYEHMREEIEKAIERCLLHQKWILGPEVRELEDKIADYLGVKHCVGISSGTEALVLSLRAIAIKSKGREYFDEIDRIITTPFTFTATGDAILRAGASPVFVDIDPLTFNIDPARVEDYLTENPGGAIGIIPVHLYGRSCEMDMISALAEKHGFFVVEDVAQAFGGSWMGRRLGSMGTTGAFSFFPSKNLGGFGDGGLVATNDDELAELLRMLLKHGGKNKYNVEHIGYNARLDTLQAAVLLVKLTYLEEFNLRRRRIAERYNEGLGNLQGVVLPAVTEGHVFHQYTARLKGGQRDKFQNSLKEKGVSSMVYYPLALHRMRVFDGRSISYGNLKYAESASEEVLSLPIEPLMDDESIEQVIAAVRNALSTDRR